MKNGAQVKLFTIERAFTISSHAASTFLWPTNISLMRCHGIWMQWKYLLGHFSKTGGYLAEHQKSCGYCRQTEMLFKS